MRQALFLVSKGMPFDVAFSLEDEDRWAFCVAAGENEGSHTFDWEAGEWVAVKQEDGDGQGA